MKRSAKLRFIATLGLLTAACCWSATSAAADFTWDGGGANDNWTTDNNWAGDVHPDPTAAGDIFFGGATRLTPNTDVAYLVHSITYNAGAGTFVNSGSALTIQGGGVTNNSSVLQTINNAVVMVAPQTWSAATGDLTFGGTVNNGNALLTVDAATGRTVRINGAISGGGGLTKNNDGTLILGAANSFTGNVIVNDGTLTAGVSGALVNNVQYTIATGGTLNMNNFSLTMSALNNSGGNITMGTGALTVNQSINSELTGNITGTTSTAVFTKQGTGTLILSGTNNVAGGYVVSAGTLQAGAATGLTDGVAYTVNGGKLDLNSFNRSMSSLSGTGGEVAIGTTGGTLTVNQSTNTTYGGVISGSGGGGANLTKDGTGTLILTGTNTYNGITTITAGTLQGDTNSIKGNVTNNANLIFNQNTDAAFANNITSTNPGAGTFTKNGTGNLTLSGTNTYQGGTTINAGTLTMGGAAALPSGTSNANYTINGGTLALGTNDLTTSKLTGTGGAITTGTGSVLTASTTTTDTFAGNITGTGGFEKIGTGTQILTGTNTYSGNTTVTAGVLQGNTASLQGAIANNSTVAFNQTTDGTYSGIMSGSGIVNKTGTGTLTFSANSNYTGDTNVTAGRLNIDGKTTSDTNVGVSGVLGGVGTISGIVTNLGVVSAGNSGDATGKLTVNGMYDGTGGTTRATISDNGDSSRLDVTGTANLDSGTLDVNAQSGTYNAGQKFKVMSYASHNGEFDSVTDNLNFLDAVASYTSDGVTITLLRNGVTYASIGRTRNQIAVGGYLDEISATASGDLATVFSSLNFLSNNEIRQAYNQLGGASHATLAQVGVQNTTLIIGQVASRLRAMPYTAGSQGGGQTGSFAPDMMDVGSTRGDTPQGPITLVSCGPDGCGEEVYGLNNEGCDCGGPDGCCSCRKQTWQGWAQGYGIGGAAKTDGNADGFSYGMGGVVGGIERWVNDHQLVGWWGGYVGSNVAVDGDQQINGGQLGAYINTQHDNSYTTWLAGAEFDGYTTKRHLDFGDIDRFASADSSGWQAFAYWERGLSIESCTEVFQPFVALQYVFLRQNEFSETGADSINLNGGGTDTNSLRSILGARLQHAFYNHNGRRSLPEVHAMWLHEYLDTNTVLTSQFAGGGSAPGFAVQGLDLGRDWAVVGCNFTWEMHDCWSMFVNYDCQTNSQQTFHIGSGGIGHMW